MAVQDGFEIKFPGIMTAGQLAEALKQIPPEMLVSSEGCDCVGPSDGISVWKGFDGVLRLCIDRNDDLDK